MYAFCDPFFMGRYWVSLSWKVTNVKILQSPLELFLETIFSFKSLCSTVFFGHGTSPGLLFKLLQALRDMLRRYHLDLNTRPKGPMSRALPLDELAHNAAQ